MKSTKFLLLFALLMIALATTISAASTIEQAFVNKNNEDDSESESLENSLYKSEVPILSLRGTSRFMAHKSRARMTCNKYPRVCWMKGSPGPDCCKKKCVNVFEDRHNCGMCGKKCKYSEICCKGKCVNPWTNTRHCGSCNNKCKNGSSCSYGMCSYA